jgi:hypothetical protein
MADVAIIQEPWMYWGQLRDLMKSGRTVYDIQWQCKVLHFVKNHINALPLLEFSSRNTTTVRITGGGDCGELTVTSAYLPYNADKPLPTKEMRAVIDYCHTGQKQLIPGYDANEHYILWGEHRHLS